MYVRPAGNGIGGYMELEKQPETEQEYWAAIESLGSFTHSTYRGFMKGHVDGSVLPDIEAAGTLQKRLAEELGVKFNIILPPDSARADAQGNYPPPPEGKRWYWEWYRQMKQQWLQAEYNKQICSACPFSSGDLQIFSHQIPCQVFHGSLFRLRAEHRCGMVDCGEWTRTKLLQQIVAKAGTDALAKFKKKEEELTPTPPSA